MVELFGKAADSVSCLISLRHLHIDGKTTLIPEIGKLNCLQTLPYFHVGGEKGFEIPELGKLKDLKGKLEIRNLEKVRDKNEATSAGLPQKPRIYKLKLVWDSSREGDEENDESVLEGLEPLYPNLKKLRIQGYKGKSLPLWTSNIAVQLNNLMEIKLIYCSEVEELPSLGQLPNLKYLKLSDLTNVRSIGSFYGINNCGNTISNNGVCTINVVVFPALKRLELWYMTNLKEWDEASSDQPSEVVVFPHLEHLSIFRCDQLMSAPSHFPRLKELGIYGMESGLPLGNICGVNLTTLTNLTIHGINELECLPDGLFSNNRNLSKLEILYCTKMTHLVPLLILPGGGGAPSLRELSIWDCWSLRELPDDFHSLNSLEKLDIRGCPQLKSIPSSRGSGRGQQQFFNNGNNLKELEKIRRDCPNLGGGWALSLKELRISNCESLRELPDDLHSLNSLEKLVIERCPELKSMPSKRGGGQQQQQEQGFSSLKELRIWECVELTNLPIEMLESCALSLEKLQLTGLISLTQSNASEVINGCLPKMTRLTFLEICGVPKFNIFGSANTLIMGTSSPDCSWNNVSFNDTFDVMLLRFTSLRELTLRGMEHWECLPDGIQHLTSLPNLILQNFGIEALPEWFGNLSSLETLELSCKKLRHFPSKQAMQRLSKLTTLRFCNCPLLLKEKRSKITSLCIKEEGRNNNTKVVDSEWHKISHIPTIYVEFEPLK